MCQLAHPLLKASGNGSIVFVSSVAGLVYVGGGSVYASTKGKLLILSGNMLAYKHCLWKS